MRTKHPFENVRLAFHPFCRGSGEKLAARPSNCMTKLSASGTHPDKSIGFFETTQDNSVQTLL
jgi:hypothetical protein